MSPCSSRITLAIEKMPCGREYKLRDLSLADFGRQQIQLAESDMPGLMALRSEFSPSQPLKGVSITGCLHLTTQTAVLIETLTTLGASVRWCSSNPYSTQDHAAAAVAGDSAAVFAWKGQSFQEYWWSMERALDWGEQGGPDLLIDDVGDAALFIHEGVRIEEECERGGESSDLESKKFDNERSRTMLQWIKESVDADPRRFRKIKERLVGITEQTHSGVRRVYQLLTVGNLFFPTIDVNDAPTTKRIDNIHGVEQSFLASFTGAADHIAIGGKHAVVLGFGNVGRGVVRALKGVGARVTITEINPIRALKALFEGFHVRRIEEVVAEADIFVTATGNIKVLTFEHIQQMKSNAIICNVGSFEDEIDIEGLNDTCVDARSSFPQIEKESRAQGIDIERFDNLHVYLESDKRIIVLAGGRELNFVCASGPPSFVRSCSFSNQVMALFELWNNKESHKYESRVYALPKHLDEKVASLHLEGLGSVLTELDLVPKKTLYLNDPTDGPSNIGHRMMLF